MDISSSVPTMLESLAIISRLKNLPSLIFKHIFKKYVYIGQRKEIDNRYPLAERYKNAATINIVAYACIDLCSQFNRDFIENAINKNEAKFNFIVVNPSSEAAKEIKKYKIYNERGNTQPGYSTKAAINSINKYLSMNPHHSGNIKIYLTDINLPYALMLIKDKQDKCLYLKVDIYAIDAQDYNRPSFIIKDPKGELYEFYLSQWKNILENHATPCPYTEGGYSI